MMTEIGQWATDFGVVMTCVALADCMTRGLSNKQRLAAYIVSAGLLFETGALCKQAQEQSAAQPASQSATTQVVKTNSSADFPFVWRMNYGSREYD